MNLALDFGSYTRFQILPFLDIINVLKTSDIIPSDNFPDILLDRFRYDSLDTVPGPHSNPLLFQPFEKGLVFGFGPETISRPFLKTLFEQK